jgi:hypothetical protein
MRCKICGKNTASFFNWLFGFNCGFRCYIYELCEAQKMIDDLKKEVIKK